MTRNHLGKDRKLALGTMCIVKLTGGFAQKYPGKLRHYYTRFLEPCITTMTILGIGQVVGQVVPAVRRMIY